MSNAIIVRKCLIPFVEYCIFFFVNFSLLFILRKFKFLSGLLFEQILFVSIISFTLWILYAYVNTRAKKTEARYSTAEILALIMIFINIASFSLVNIDRSRSFYILSWVDKQHIVCRDGEIDVSAVPSNEKLNPVAVQERLLEQSERGLIRITSKECKLSWGGHLYLGIAKIAANTFELNGWKSNT